MRWFDLDRYELLASLSSDFSSDICEFLDTVVPGIEDGRTMRHGSFERRVLHVQYSLRTEDFEELFVQVSGDSFDERKGSSNGVRTNAQQLCQSAEKTRKRGALDLRKLELLVDVDENKVNTVLYSRKIGGGEKFVQGEIFHKLVVLVN